MIQRTPRPGFTTVARLLVWLAAIVPCLVQASTPLAGAWRAAQPGDTPAGVLAEAAAGRLTTFDPTRLQVFPRGQYGAWVVLQPAPPWIELERVLSIRSPMFGRVTLYDAHGPLHVTSLDDFGPGLHGHGRLAFELPAYRSGSAPVLLKFEPTHMLAAPVTFRLQSMDEYRHDDAQWLTLVGICFGVMLAMAGMALVFALMLRDMSFGWYVGYIAAYLLVQGMQTGFLYHPLGLEFLAGSELSLGTLAVAMSVGFAVLFMLRFCDLARHAPTLQALLLWLTMGMMAIVTMRIIAVPYLRETAQALLNPWLALCTTLTLLAAVVSALRGARTAWFFLAGWAPLLVLTALASAQVGGALPHVDWLNEACIVAGALQSVVLSVGLADRALTMRHDRDRARALADRDALTGLLNRRAWTEAAEKRLATSGLHKYVLLFLDLDNFKKLNDHYGHAAGDHALLAVAKALREELRPEDLFGRYGGEEFVALLDGIERSSAMHIAARLCRRVDALDIPVDDKGLLLTVSIGAAQQRMDDSVASLVRRADTAMYAAKARGRNRVMWETGNSKTSRLRVVADNKES
jgi:diguanylate cyclase (GGDEF)-like protein